MTWSYDPKAVSSVPLMEVRLLIGDTDKSDQLLEDEEIQYFIDTEGSVINAAVVCCQTIAAQFARFTDEKTGQMSLSLRQRWEHYNDLAKNLKRRNAMKNVLPYAGGTIKDEKETTQDNTDLVKPSFTRAMHENENKGRVYPDSVYEPRDDDTP